MAEQLKLPEVARRLGVSEKTARRYVKAGALPSVFVGGAYRVSEEDLEEYLQDARVTPEDDSPKAGSRSSLETSFNDVLGEEWRARYLHTWQTYASKRAKWCERVLEKTPDEEYNNPFLSLDGAIQWAIYVGVETADLRNTIETRVIPEAVAPPGEIEEMRTVLDRLSAISERTDARVRAMMEEAALDEGEKQARLRLIYGQRGA